MHIPHGVAILRKKKLDRRTNRITVLWISVWIIYIYIYWNYIEIILKLYWIISNHILNYIQYLFCKRSAMLLSGSGRGEHCTGLVAWNLGKWTGAERAERRAERPGTIDAIDAIDAIDVAVAGTARCWETSDLLGSELSHPMSHHKEGFCRFPGELPILLDREPRFRPCASQTWHLLPRA